jgi:hypothetical protein
MHITLVPNQICLQSASKQATKVHVIMPDVSIKLCLALGKFANGLLGSASALQSDANISALQARSVPSCECLALPVQAHLQIENMLVTR